LLGKMMKHLFSPNDLLKVRNELKKDPTVNKETLSDFWYVKDGNVEARRVLYYNPLLVALPEDKEARILDCACGSGGLLQTFMNAGYQNLTGIDRSKVAIALARERCKKVNSHFFVGDICFIEEMENAFDVITFTEILEHLENDVEILEKATGKLNANGYFICSVPYEQKNIGVTDDHVRSYSKETIIERYSRFGDVKIIDITKGAYLHAIFTIKGKNEQ